MSKEEAELFLYDGSGNPISGVFMLVKDHPYPEVAYIISLNMTNQFVDDKGNCYDIKDCWECQEPNNEYHPWT